jgi:hypothetical protein
VNALFADVMSNEEEFVNESSKSRKIGKQQKNALAIKTKYHENYVNAHFQINSEFPYERPSSVLTNASDDRLVAPRLGIEIQDNDTNIYIDVYNTQDNS